MSTVTGPLAGTCPEHGHQIIVSMGSSTVTFACGGVGCTEDGFTHPACS